MGLYCVLVRCMRPCKHGLVLCVSLVYEALKTWTCIVLVWSRVIILCPLGLVYEALKTWACILCWSRVFRVCIPRLAACTELVIHQSFTINWTSTIHVLLVADFIVTSLILWSSTLVY